MPQRKMTIPELIEMIPQANFAWNGKDGAGVWWSKREPDMSKPLSWGPSFANYLHGLTLDIGPGELVNLIERAAGKADERK